MVLSSHGLDISEEDLRNLCDCKPDGTDSLHAVQAAQLLGFEGTRRYNKLTLNQLATLIADGLYPYVEVDLLPIDGMRVRHAMVVIGVDSQAVTVLDPHYGERPIPTEKFGTAWSLTGNLTTIVSPKFLV